MRSKLCAVFATVSVGLAAGCADIEDESVEGDTSAIWRGWGDTRSPPEHPEIIQAMAVSNNGTAYSWNNDGFVCRGTPTFLCNSRYPYAAPGNVYTDIRAIGINAANHVYTWYKTKYYSVGDSANLTSRNQGKPFDCVHQMDQLIDVYNAVTDPLFEPLGRWYYYYRAWGLNGWSYWRTVGTPDRCDAYEGERQVTVHPDHGDIVGVDYNRTNGNQYAWYADGWLNASTSKLNLGQK